ncbi:amino acid adenylation domain-containing protein [candidate division KSB1 bacterium]|nr:amino acid adenylation domain-containing protein [candidate division KSB1 bacterium]RQW04811.1 MAG: amino acid adenylation domain-containing protein [candidate division KSB1 bacterium]
MTDYSQVLASLSPEKRRLLELKLVKQGAAYNTFPVSFSQQRLWFLQQLEPESFLYNIPLVTRFQGALDVSVLEKTIQTIIARHEILRTSFTKISGKPYQRVEKSIDFNLPVDDLTIKPREQQEQEVQRCAVDEWHLPFDLATAPMFRARLLKLAADEYVLIFILHHIITDGWSNGVLLREVAVTYHSLAQGQPSPLRDLDIQYADFANWQQNYLSGQVYDEQLSFWKNTLADAPSHLNLPTDKPRPQFQTNRGTTALFTLSKELSKRVKDFSNAEGVTLFMTLLAVWQIVLSRFSGQDDICVGTPIANRTKKQLENLIGFFVNTLVLRTNLAGAPTFRQVLQRVKEVTLDAYAHQDMPFEKLVEELQPERDTSYTPLFQIMFVMQNKQSGEAQLPGLNISEVDLPKEISTFDLTLGIHEGDEQLGGSLEYNTDLFEAATIDRLIHFFALLLEKMLEAPDKPIAQVSLVSPDEYNQVIVEWNNTDKNFDDDYCLHDLLQRAHASPETVAIIAGSQQITYGELEQRANQVAHYLIKKGARPEKLVGLSIERSIDMIVGLLGILKSGAAYLPLDPEYPPERLAFMIEDAGITTIVTQVSQKEALAAFQADLVVLDEEWSSIAAEASDCPLTAVTPKNLAYVIYTSGSTGTPKGVLVQHAAVANHNLATIADYEITEKDKLLQFSSINFDAAVEEIFPTLMAGATLVLRPAGPVLSVFEFIQLVEKEEVTILDIPTAYWHQLVYELEQKNVSVPASVRVVIIGGERASLERFVTWQTNGGADVELTNSYGPTETAVVCTAFFTKRENFVAETKSSLPIGRPIANVTNYVLDDYFNPVPMGWPGELYVGGKNVTRGYLNRPDVTAESFLPDPFSARPGSVMYKTGDLVRFLQDGALDYIGRADFQVKIRGFRVELGEIEALLHDYTGVRECAVFAHTLSTTEKIILAYVAGDPALDEKTLRHYVAERLPAYMVPAKIVIIETIPKTPSGKLNKRQLPIPTDLSIESTSEFVAPRTPTEEMLTSVYAELLRVDRVGIHDNFFDLGGHSLIATQLVSRIRDVLGIELPLRHLFDGPTVAHLSEIIDRKKSDKDGVDRPPILPAPAEVTEKPLSFAQQRMWFLDQLEPGNPQYNIPDAVRIKGDLNVDILTRCLQAVVDRHKVLRTAFITIEGKPKLRVWAELNISIPVVDISQLSEAERQTKAQSLVLENAKTGFDLGLAPLFRVRLIRLSEDEHIFASTMHHSISDGWSFGLLVREVGTLYERLSRGDNTPLPPLKIQYADFAYWQQQWLHGERLTKEIEYWKNQLGAGDEVLELPTDFKRPSFQTTNGAHCSFSLSRELTASLNALTAQHNVTLFMTLLAAFQTLLYRYTQQDFIAVGSPIANRNHSEIENLIGFFVNTLVLKTDFSGHPSFRAVLERVKEVTLGAYAHQDVPFEKLVDALEPERDTSRTPLFQVMFLLQNMPSQSLTLSGLTFEQINIETHTSNFDLTLAMEEHAGQLVGGFEYNTDLFEASTIHRMIEHLKTLLQEIVAAPDKPVSDYSLLPEAERKRIVHEWNDTAVAYDALPLFQLFEQQVIRTPDFVAVKAGGEQLTYAELNERANQVAHYLIKQGAQADSLVGLCYNRSLEMIVALFGILKSGAGYLPLDPNYPKERIDFMLNDAAVRIVLTEEKLASIFASETIHLTCLDSEWDKIAAEPVVNPDVPVDGNALAYVIYTSGSTGTPKGVLVTHAGVVNHNNIIRHDFYYTSSDKILQFFSLNFDGAVEEIFPTLISGATLVLRPAGVVMSVDELLDFVDREQITILDLPTAYWHEMVHELDAYDKIVPPSVRLVIAGGEAASPERYALWIKQAGKTVQWVNTYGPTEGTIIATLYDPAENEQHRLDFMPIGKPLPNYKIYILDQRLNPTPVGVPGELCIGGAGVARGYLNRPDLTAEKFIPDAWSQVEGARIYRTGDLARFLPDGNIEFIGRVDDQVKVRGFRVELGEIEASSRGHANIRDVVVVARRDGGKDVKLAAYFVTENDVELTAAELRAFLKESVPDYMIPHAFMRLDELPKLISGKINRKALPRPDVQYLEGETVAGEPENEIEEKLLSIFRDILGRQDIGTRNNFFELGGDSIMSIQVIAKANQAGIRLTPKLLFEKPTIAGLAAVAVQGGVVVAEQGLIEGPVELTPIQRWFFEQDFAAPHHWNQSLLLGVMEALDGNALEKAVYAVQQHHDMLRARFILDGSRQQLVVAEEPNQVLYQFDLSRIEETQQRQHIEEKCAELQASFNLQNGPIFLCANFNLGSTSRLFIAVHHLVMDGVSWRILLEDIQTAYQQAAADQAIRLPAKTTSFQYWAQQLAQYAQSQTVKDELPTWSHYERQLVSPIPVDAPDQRSNNYEADTEAVFVALTREETNTILHELPGQFGAQINHLLLTAFVEAYAQWSGKRSVLIDMEGHGREMLFENVDTSRTMGWFTVLYPLFLKAERAQDAKESVHSIKRQLDQTPRFGIGYGLLRYMTDDPDIRQKLANMPQPEISFNYLGQLDQVLEKSSPFKPARENKGADRSATTRRENLLDVTAQVSGERLSIHFAYSSQIHKRSSIERFADFYIKSLQRLISPPEHKPEAETPPKYDLAKLDKRQLGKVLGQLNKGKGK